jgi:hypothetical protein
MVNLSALATVFGVTIVTIMIILITALGTFGTAAPAPPAQTLAPTHTAALRMSALGSTTTAADCKSLMDSPVQIDALSYQQIMICFGIGIALMFGLGICFAIKTQLIDTSSDKPGRWQDYLTQVFGYACMLTSLFSTVSALMILNLNQTNTLANNLPTTTTYTKIELEHFHTLIHCLDGSLILFIPCFFMLLINSKVGCNKIY